MLKSKLLLPLITLLSIAACSTTGTNILDLSSSSNRSGSSYQASTTYKQFMLNNPKKDFNTQDTSTLGTPYVNSLTSLSEDLYHSVYDEDNKVFSPISIANCFSMLLEGAKENSKAELESFLHYNSNFDHRSEIKNMLLRNAINDDENETYLDICQSFWSDYRFKDTMKQAYVDTLTNYYYAEAFNGDLSSDAMHGALADYINDKTRGFLNVKKEDFRDFAGVLWLLNTIYLKSQWVEQFSTASNKVDDFENLDQTKKQVTFMKNTDRSYYLKRDNYVISTIPLKHGFRFNILLPNKNTDYGTILNDQTAIGDLHSFDFVSSLASADINFKIPQFKIQKSIDLKELLSKMGVSDIFDPYTANLRDIADLQEGENLFVSKAKHEAGIEIKNEGLEAAAYTIIEVAKATSVDNPIPPIDFIVDHPFAFSLTNKDGIPLFTGVVTNL